MNASSSMHSRLAVRQELGSDVGSASITPIDPTRPSAAERPTRGRAVNRFRICEIKYGDVVAVLNKLTTVDDCLVAGIPEKLCENLCRHVVCGVIGTCHRPRECVINIDPNGGLLLLSGWRFSTLQVRKS